ncbi:hypothetical protein [Vampirovibrio sp.]
MAYVDFPLYYGMYVKPRKQSGQTEITFQFEDPDALPGALGERYPMGTL